MFIEIKDDYFVLNDSVIVSIDTLHPYDLYRQFSYVLEGAIYQPVAVPNNSDDLFDRYADYWNSEHAQFVIDDQIEQIEAHCSPGYYFGASEGDGACFGIWKMEPELLEVEQDWQNETIR